MPDLLRRAAQALAPRGKNALECTPAEGGIAHRLGQDEAYFTVREILAEASTAVPPKAGLSRERSDFYRFGYATLGYTFDPYSNKCCQTTKHAKVDGFVKSPSVPPRRDCASSLVVTAYL